MRRSSRRIASVFLALLVLSSGFAGPAAAANGLPDGCSPLDNFIHDLLTFQNVNEGDSPCSTTAQVNQAIEDMKESDANQTKVDIYSAGAAEKASIETFSAVYDNYLQDTEAAAWMKAQTALAQAYENGSTETQARVAAKEAIAEYYTTKAINLIQRSNNTITRIYYLQQQAENESDIDASFVRTTGREGSDYCGCEINKDITGVGSTSVTLPNGSSHGVKTLKHADYGHPLSLVDGWSDHFSNDAETDSYVNAVEIAAPNSNYNDMEVYNFADEESRYDTIQNANSQLQSEVDPFVDATYGDFQSGEINASDVISANTAMFEYGVRTANESEGFYNSVGALALMGYDTPNLNSTGVFNVSYQGNTYQGIVMAESAPEGSWETGTTYNESNFSSPVFIATVDGEKVDIGSGENFTITGMTNKQGESVTTVETREYVYKTANTSELLALQESLTELRKEIEAREPDGSGIGGGFGFDSNRILLGALAVAGIYILGTRS